jgi:hypothetical protein
MKNVLKWLGAIAGSVIAGVVVWWLTTSGGGGNAAPTSQPPPVTQIPASFLERVSGHYTLLSWDEAAGPITMGVGVKDGTLQIDRNGNADWQLGIWDSAAHPDPPSGSAPSQIKCGGRVSSQSQEVSWVSGGDRNVAIDWEPGIESVRDMVWPAFCGGDVGGVNAPFSLNLDEQSDGRNLLEMSNSEGTFRWVKQN